jgi:hypothetical protein
MDQKKAAKATATPSKSTVGATQPANEKKSVLELLEEDDEFEVKLFSLFLCKSFYLLFRSLKVRHGKIRLAVRRISSCGRMTGRTMM